MKYKVLKVPCFAIFLMLIVSSCQKEIAEKNGNIPIDIVEAREWYESLYSSEIILGTKNIEEQKMKAKPDWNLAFVSQLRDSKTVEVPLILQSDFGITTEECYQAFKETGDIQFLLSRTSMVIEKNGDRTRGFLMTIIPDKDYKVVTDFDAFSSSYKKWQKDFSGAILYHKLDGCFANGWKLLRGKVITTVKHLGESTIPIELTKGCTNYYLITTYYTCPYMASKGSNSGCYVTGVTSEYLYSICDGSGSGGGTSSDASYEPAYTPPCIGDPILNPTIASSGNSGTAGGMYGCVRKGNSVRCNYLHKPHDGVDVACPLNTDIYSMYPGYVYDIRDTFNPGECMDKSYGNYIIVRYDKGGGNYMDVFYAHLNSVNVAEGDLICPSQFIGQSGNTGSAGDVGIVPHLHIEIRENGTRVNPAPYFGTNFTSDGTVNVSCTPDLNF